MRRMESGNLTGARPKQLRSRRFFRGLDLECHRERSVARFSMKLWPRVSHSACSSRECRDEAFRRPTQDDSEPLARLRRRRRPALARFCVKSALPRCLCAWRMSWDPKSQVAGESVQRLSGMRRAREGEGDDGEQSRSRELARARAPLRLQAVIPILQHHEQACSSRRRCEGAPSWALIAVPAWWLTDRAFSLPENSSAASGQGSTRPSSRPPLAPPLSHPSTQARTGLHLHSPHRRGSPYAMDRSRPPA